MRFIDNDDLEVDEEWESNAATLRAAIASALEDSNESELEKLYRRANSLWASFKPRLSTLSSGKCWYCECLETRSDLNVDHFRPKSRVAEAPSHPGYWWLMLSPPNFRLACQFCNQRRLSDDGPGGGKADHFPVLDEANRASGPDDDIELEEIVLLDPTEAIDSSLLSFGYDGIASPNDRSCTDGSIEEARAVASIDLYHLNHQRIIGARKMLNKELKRELESAARLLRSTPSADSSAVVRSTVKALKRSISAEAELSAAARAYLRSQRGQDGMIGELVTALIDH